MKLGIFTVLFQNLSFEDALDKVAAAGLEAVEIGTGGYPGSPHCDVEALLADPAKARAYRQAVESRGLMISALSVHGNPIHPNAELAKTDHDEWRRTALLAELLEVPVINVLSGCPGDHPSAKYPNWATCAWPPDYMEILEWQWPNVVIPYWQREAAYAREHGVRIAVEMHPGFVVYNPETLLKLREAVGPEIGCNFDPSHLFWLGVDPVQAIREIGRAGALFHVHAKDTYIDLPNVRRNGVLDTKHYDQILDRAWTFRTVGYGQGEKVWRDIMSAFRSVDYDYVLSIEHEDAMLSVEEGLEKSVGFLKSILFRESRGEMFWA